MLDHHDRVRFVWNRCAGHDLERLTRTQRFLLAFSRPHFAAYPQRPWNVSTQDGKAVSQGAAQRRIVPVCENRFG